jgi:hypothetical protein
MLGTKWQANSVDGVMFSVLAPSVVDCGFAPRSVQTKYYEIVIFFCLSAKHAVLRSKSKDFLAQNQNKVRVERYVYLWTVVSMRI